MTMNHAREAACAIEIACARDGTVLGLRGHADVDMGAYMRTNGAVGARNIAQFMSGPYRVPNIDIDVALLLTNKTPVGTTVGRDASRPISSASGCSTWRRATSVSIRSSSAGATWCARPRCPTRSPTIAPFESKDELDSGDYAVTLDRCLAEIGWAGKAKLKGRCIDGPPSRLAVSCFIEGGAAGRRRARGWCWKPTAR